MRILYIGSVQFSRSALELLVRLKAEVVGICTLAQSSFNADHVDLSDLGRQHNIPVLLVDDINSNTAVDWMAEKSPDVIFCFGWSRLLGREVRDIAPMGALGFHPSALPANKGRHPLIWPLVLGLKETASTFFFMDAGADSGDILSQCRLTIDDEDDAGTLYQKVTAIALRQIAEFLPQLSAGTFTRNPQDPGAASTWRKRGRSDGLIDWRMSARSIRNLVRGLTRPYVGAAFLRADSEVKVWKATIVEGAPENMEPGRVWKVTAAGPVIKCGEAAVCLAATEPPLTVKAGDYL